MVTRPERFLLSASVIALGLGALWTAPAAAQTAGDSTLEEVVVTARKREESLQSVPVAVSALSGAALEERTLREASDLQRVVPGLNMSGSAANTGTGTNISIRGQVAGDNLITFSQPVGLYLDSVNIPHPVGSNISFFDIARVEVLKGPQGTLYGRNTTGGAVNVITRGADYSGIHGFAYGEYGNFNNWKLAGAINVPIVEDKLAVRVAAQHWDREGFGESAVTGQDFGGTHDDDIVRLSVAFDPSPNFTSIFKFEYIEATRSDSMYQMRQLVNNPALCTGFGIAQPCAVVDAEWVLEGRRGGVAPSQLIAQTRGDLFTNYSQQVANERLKVWHAAWDSTWDITDTVSLRSITGMHDYEDFRIFDLDAINVTATEVGFASNGFQLTGPFPPVPFGLNPEQATRQWTQEFNLSGEFMDRLNWLVGAFYSYDKGNGAQVFGQLPGLGSLPRPAGQGFPFVAQYDSPRVTNQSWALFTQNDIRFTDRVSITLGARYTEERLTQRIQASLFNLTPGVANPWLCLAGPNANGTFFATEESCQLAQSAVFSGTSYLASFNFQITPDQLFYAKTARGFRGGALQVRAPTFPAARPEIATDYELGYKADFFDRRLRANLAAYRTNYENKQETAIIIINGVTSTPVQNAASAKITGFEGEFTANPMQGLTLRAAVNYINAEYESFPAGVTPFGIVDLSGQQFTTTPEWTYSLGARYVTPVGPGDLAFDVDWAWRGELPTTPQNNDPAIPRALQDEWRESIGLLNAAVSYELRDMGLTLSAFATNLLDEEYQRQSLSFNTFGYTGQTQDPRMYGVSIRKTFGDE